MVDLVGGRTPLRKVGSRYTGRCPFHDERSPSFSVDPVDKQYYCFGCGRGGDAIRFAQETENLDFVGAVEWLGRPLRRRGRLRGDLAPGRAAPRRAAAAAGPARGRGRLLHPLPVGVRPRPSPRAPTWRSAASTSRPRATSGSGSRRPPGTGCAPPPGRRGSRRPSSSARGSRAAAGAARVDRFRGRLMFPLADARGRVRGFGARQMPGGEPPKYLNSPEGTLFRKSEVVYGARSGPHDDRRADPRDRGRGLHRRARPAPGRPARVGRVDGHGAHRAAGARARPVWPAPGRSTWPSTPTRPARRRRCAGCSSPRRPGCRCGSWSCPRAATRPTWRSPTPTPSGRRSRPPAACSRFRIGRILTAPGSRDQRYQRAAAVLRRGAARRSSGPSRCASSPAGWSSPRTSRPALMHAARRRRTGLRTPHGACRRSPRERDERLFLAMCLALPDRGRILLGDLDVAHFSMRRTGRPRRTSAACWRARTFRRHPHGGHRWLES